MKHKYVRHSGVGFVLWPMSDDLFHSHIGEAMLREVPRGSIISAGFAYIANGQVRCEGKSESLQIASLPEDSAALARQLGLGPRNGL